MSFESACVLQSGRNWKNFMNDSLRTREWKTAWWTEQVSSRVHEIFECQTRMFYDPEGRPSVILTRDRKFWEVVRREKKSFTSKRDAAWTAASPILTDRPRFSSLEIRSTSSQVTARLHLRCRIFVFGFREPATRASLFLGISFLLRRERSRRSPLVQT